MRRKPDWPVISSFLIGALFLVPAAILLRNTWAFVATAQTVPGVVVGQEAGADGEGSFPVVSFATPDGLKHQFRGTVSASLSAPVGSSVEVLYDPSDPSRARIKRFLSLWLGPLAFGGFGSLVILVGVLLLLRVGDG